MSIPKKNSHALKESQNAELVLIENLEHELEEKRRQIESLEENIEEDEDLLQKLKERYKRTASLFNSPAPAAPFKKITLREAISAVLKHSGPLTFRELAK